MRKILGVSAAAILLASCSGDREGTIETEDGDIEYSIDGADGSAQFNGTDDEGNAISVNTGTDVPVDLPDGYSIYPGASVISNSVITMGDGGGSVVLMNSSDSVEKVTAFYRSQAEAAGIEIALENKSGTSTMLAGEGEGGKSFTLSASDNDGTTTVQLMVGQQLPQ